MSNLKEDLEKMVSEYGPLNDMTRLFIYTVVEVVNKSNKDLLERIRSEVVGDDDPKMTKDIYPRLWYQGRNELRAEQRSALQKIEDEINGSR